MMNDTIAGNLSNILNYEKTGKSEIEIRFNSKLFRLILEIMNEKGYVGKYKIIENNIGNKLIIDLIGKINNCGFFNMQNSVDVVEQSFIKISTKFKK